VVRVIRTNEERMIAADVCRLLKLCTDEDIKP
jgi:acetate kinase